MTDAVAPPSYRLSHRIGRGGSGEVWAAEQQSTGRIVALKILGVDLDDPNAQRRFAREREAMSRLSANPHIVTVYDAGVHNGRPWLAMELCHRGSLARHTAESGSLDSRTAISVLRGCAAALEAAHRLGIVHCDVKPANVMVTDHGQLALGDFGIARTTVGRATTTTRNGFTLDHAAPELLDGQSPSPAVDIYSLGTTIWELLAGRPPFRENDDVSVATVMRRILLEPLPALPDDVPAELAELIVAMTAKVPEDRPADMTAVASRAAELEAAVGAPAADPFPAIDPPVELGSGPGGTRAAAAEPEPGADADEWIATRLRQGPTAPQPEAVPAARPWHRRRRMPIVAALAAVVALGLTVVAIGGYRGAQEPVTIDPAARATTTVSSAPVPTVGTPSPTTVADPTADPTPEPPPALHTTVERPVAPTADDPPPQTDPPADAGGSAAPGQISALGRAEQALANRIGADDVDRSSCLPWRYTPNAQVVASIKCDAHEQMDNKIVFLQFDADAAMNTFMSGLAAKVQSVPGSKCRDSQELATSWHHREETTVRGYLVCIRVTYGTTTYTNLWWSTYGTGVVAKAQETDGTRAWNYFSDHSLLVS